MRRETDILEARAQFAAERKSRANAVSNKSVKLPKRLSRADVEFHRTMQRIKARRLKFASKPRTAEQEARYQRAVQKRYDRVRAQLAKKYFFVGD